MRGVWMSVVVVGGLAHGAPALKDRPEAGPGLAGDWEAVELTVGGRPLDLKGVRTGYRFTPDGRRGQIHGGRAPDRLDPFVADPRARPAAIDLMDAAKPGGPVSVGIYRVDGDRLTLCLVPIGTPRPTEVGPPAAGTRYVLRRLATGD
jgi:uncharacterized protein (TIGR03067 family)